MDNIPISWSQNSNHIIEIWSTNSRPFPPSIWNPSNAQPERWRISAVRPAAWGDGPSVKEIWTHIMRSIPHWAETQHPVDTIRAPRPSISADTVADVIGAAASLFSKPMVDDSKSSSVSDIAADSPSNEALQSDHSNQHPSVASYMTQAIQSYFGYYPSRDSVKLFDVTGSGNEHYFYWRSEYSYRSVQGYYDVNNNMELDIGINYDTEKLSNGEEQWYADWVLFYNNEKFAENRENVSNFYGDTPNCHIALIDGLTQYGFRINDSSSYKKIEVMSYQELLNAL